MSNVSHTLHILACNDFLSADSPLISFVQCLLEEAIQQNVSDIHLEPHEHYYCVRYRQDGMLTTICRQPLSLADRVTMRLKVLANLDISEHRLPQEGRFKFTTATGTAVDCRLSICPMLHGEKSVIRLLNTHKNLPNLDDLFFTSTQRSQVLQELSRPNGMILVTGPTGSGKTMTLYAALNYLNRETLNLSTAEDPVELDLPGLNQVNVNYKLQLTFQKLLIAFLRQDPDVIMIGEIRELETADTAFKAALTGHLILSTVHTKNTSETITRLINLGVEPFVIADGLNLIIAQRLARRLCDFCKIFHEELTSLSFTTYKAHGCSHCQNGYTGRIAFFEVMPISSAIHECILERSSSLNIQKKAEEAGMQTLYASGLELVKAGLTTLEEILRVC